MYYTTILVDYLPCPPVCLPPDQPEADWSPLLCPKDPNILPPPLKLHHLQLPALHFADPLPIFPLPSI